MYKRIRITYYIETCKVLFDHRIVIVYRKYLVYLHMSRYHIIHCDNNIVFCDEVTAE